MAFVTSIQYYPGEAFLGSGGNQAIADWVRNQFFIVDGGASKIFRYALDGTQVNQAPFTEVAPPFAIDPQGFIYNQKTASNFNGQQKLTQDLEFVGSWGVPSGFANLPNGVGLPVNLAAIKCGDGDWLYGVTQNLDYHIWMVYGTGLVFGGLYYEIDENGITCVAGASSDTPPEATAFAVGWPSFGGPVQLGVYKTTIQGNAFVYNPDSWPDVNTNLPTVKIATIPVATIDATWTNIEKPGVIYDSTDGNLILMVQTSDSVVVKSYLLKVNGTTGAIMWQIPWFTYASGNNQPGQSRIRHGIFCGLDTSGSNHNLHTVDTIAGTDVITSDGFAGLEIGPQSFDDTSGVIFGNFNFVSGAGAPIARGDTPPAYSNTWSSLYCREAFPNPPQVYAPYTYTRSWVQTVMA